MAKEENIILPVLAGAALLVLFSNDTVKKPVRPPIPGKTPTDFILQYWDEAAHSQKVTGIPAIVTITQGGLESAWGRSAPRNNFFGIKADSSWHGPTQFLDTTEYINGKLVHVKARFRAYSSALQGFIDHGDFFLLNKRYKTALLYTKDPVQFAKEIAKAGYATDPNYANKLIEAMKIAVRVLQRHKVI